jgi:hypothetical protein
MNSYVYEFIVVEYNSYMRIHEFRYTMNSYTYEFIF